MIKKVLKEMLANYRFSHLSAEFGTFVTSLYFDDYEFAVIQDGVTVIVFDEIGGETFTRKYDVHLEHKAKILLEQLYKEAMHKVYKTKEVPMYRAK